MTSKQRDVLMRTLQERFEKHMERHAGLAWAKVQARLDRHPDKVRSLHEMEASGGEPDVTACDKKTGACTFVDCSAESPAGRRSLCYDEDALRSRKEHKPAGSALGAAKAMGIELLTGETEWPATNWDPATAQQQMAALLAQHPQIDGVISDYGSDVAGAIRAFQAAGRELVPMASTEANSLGCFYQDLKAANPKFELATISSRNWLGRVATRKALAAINGVPNDEPARYSLPLYEDSLGGTTPKCDASLSPDFYHSNLISAADIAQWGVVE